MSRTKLTLVVALILLVMGGIWASAQQVGQMPGMWGSGLDLVAPTVIAGSDLGFRVESIKDNIPVGTIVVRIDGRWVNAQVGGGGIVVADAR